MISTKQLEISETAKFSRLSHLLWALAFLLVSSTYSLTAAGQSGRVPSIPQEPQTAPRPLLCIQKAECLGGIKDNFKAPPEKASPSPWLIEKLSNCAGIHTEFDTNPQDGHCFGHSFVKCLNRRCKLIGAQLEIRMQAVRGLAHNDNITIFSGGQKVWSKGITMLPEANGTWIKDQTATFTIDLGALSGGGNVLNQLTGSVDVAVQDDTRIDYMQLTVQADCCGRVCGTKYLDKDGDGQRDTNEPALCGWTMLLDGGHGSARTTTTDISGGYCFDQVQPGTYTLGELSKTGWTQTSPSAPGQHTLNIKAGVNTDGLDFGNRLCKADCAPGFALDFDGKDDHVEVVNTNLINGIGAGDFTLEAWVNGLESEQSSHPPIMQNRPNSNAGFFFGFHNKWNGSANMIPFIRLGNVNWVEGTYTQPNLLDGKWHHFAVTKKGKTLTYFADGLPVGLFTHNTIGNASIAAVHSLMIGWDPLTSAFNGMIDDLCIWSVARPQCGIQTDMVTLPAATTPGLVGCWPMDEGLGQVAGDFVAGQSGRLGSSSTADNADPTWVGVNH